MHRIIRILACTALGLLLLGFSPLVRAEEMLLPRPSSLVNDSAFVLSSSEEATLEGVLRAYMDSTSRQVFVITVMDFKGYDANGFATELGNQWAAGQRGLDNGVIVLFRPGRDVLRRLGREVPGGELDLASGEADRGEGYIAVGYGLEPVLPDALAARITREIMGPAVVRGRFFDGLMETSLEVIRCTSGDPTTLGEPGGARGSEEGGWMRWLLLLPSVGIFFIAIFRAKNDPQRRPFIIAFIIIFLWLHLRLFWLIVSAAGRGGGGRSGGGGFSGGGGGSFGGGGGGSRF